MGFLDTVRSWIQTEEKALAPEIDFLKRKLISLAVNLEAIFADNVTMFLRHAEPVIAQAAVQAISGGLTGRAIEVFVFDALKPIAVALAADASHQALDSVLNTVIEMNHQEEKAAVIPASE